MRPKQSGYIHWAKTQSQARYNLCTSGVCPFPFGELPFHCEQLSLQADDGYGYRPLTCAIAAKSGVAPDCVVTAAGTSMANYLAMAALLDPGDEVLIEQPGYGPLVDAAGFIGARVKRFVRTEQSGYALDPAEVRRAITPKTRLVAITNLHNPSSALAPESVLREVVDIARSVKARLLVDEVYLDAVYEDTPQTSFHLGPEVIVTSSLTKLYGLGGLRCGWVLAQPDLACAMWRLNDLFSATPVHPGELLSLAALRHLQQIRERARRIVERDRQTLDRFLAGHPQVSAPRTKFGTTAFVRLRQGSVEPFLDRLRAEHDTSAVPGRFFDMPDHFRIGMGVDSEMFAEGLRRIGSALA